MRQVHQRVVSHFPEMCWKTRVSFCREGQVGGGGNLLLLLGEQGVGILPLQTLEEPDPTSRGNQSLRGGSQRPRKGEDFTRPL